ncbi:MAG TPA: TAXI family TRAP transporter solute-binding subunit, partial [Rhodopila sp.]|nr:TAXI family TRAP transporter solute-binding subunit [Rhodopila sp.]
MWYRRALACAALSALIAPRARAGEDPVRIAQAHNATVGVIAGSAGSTDTQIVAEMADVLDDGTLLRVLPMIGQGSLQDIADLVFLKGVDIAVVHADALAQAIRTGSVPRIESVEYITKLFQEEVHILAQRRITTLEELNGQPVEIGPPNSGTAFTAKALLDALHIRPTVRHDSPSVALDRLRLGQAAAMVVVGGKPVPA